MNTGFDAWALGVEASVVIGLRMMKLAGGGSAASNEAALMVSEKIRSNLDLATDMLTGKLGATPAGAGAVVKHYRRKVSANRRRLSR